MSAPSVELVNVYGRRGGALHFFPVVFGGVLQFLAATLDVTAKPFHGVASRQTDSHQQGQNQQNPLFLVELLLVIAGKQTQLIIVMTCGLFRP